MTDELNGNDNPVCTCDDNEFVSTVCPVHSKMGLNTKRAPIEVNDGHLLSAEQIVVKGYLFVCPNCNQSSLLVNRNYIPKVCCECKEEIVIKSKVFSDSVREENKSINATEIAVGGLM